MRKDFYVENDSGAWSLLSSSVVERVIDDGREDDGAFVRGQEVVLASLVGDDSFIARVVVGEPLAPAEDEQWIAHFRTALKVPCGRLLVTGGFDPGVFGDWVEEGSHAGVAVAEVPPGHHLVDVYTYLHSMNGRVIVDSEWSEKLGRWFRRDHPGRAFPSWVAAELARSPEDDPGHEREWSALRESHEKGVLPIETEPLDWVAFVVHLRPYDAAAALDEPEDGDWFGPGQGLRRPATFPLGVPASGARDPEVRSELREILGGEDEEDEEKRPAGPLQAVDVFSRVAEQTLRPIAGGPVSLPLAQMKRAYLLAYFATASAHPEIRLTPRRPDALQDRLAPVDGAAVSTEGGVTTIGFPELGARFATLRQLASIPADTWRRIPDGTVVELATCIPEPDEETDPAIGRMWWKGITQGEGDGATWSIDEASPEVTAAVLRDALELAAAAEDPEALRLASEAEAKSVLDGFSREWGDVLTARDPPRVQGREIRFASPEPTDVLLLATEAFRQRYRATWPVEMPELWDEDDEDDDES